jgi:FkbM family methyltransferase
MMNTLTPLYIPRRDFKRVLRALRQVRYYRAVINSFAVYNNPIDGLKRYLTGKGDYPTTLALKTPIGPIAPTLYSPHDMLTVNEIFCRHDYLTDGNAPVIVDFGSNIGLSALYFLTRNSSSRCYLFEPVPQNVEKLKSNLRGFEDRFVLEQVAVALADGVCTFGSEPSGRYGGIGVGTDTMISVQCRRANDVLEAVLAEHDQIDVLKIDIEGLEKEILADMTDAIRRKIKRIYVEARYGGKNPYDSLYTYAQHGSIAEFRLRGA